METWNTPGIAPQPSLDTKGISLHLGIDIGSTTTKTVVIDPKSRRIVFSHYMRHDAQQLQSMLHFLRRIDGAFPGASFRAAVCGSGGNSVASLIGLPFIQEVVANSLAVRTLFSKTRTAIELGGQDAKMVFFAPDADTGQTNVSDMRMNGSCAGGTGAFIDEIAALLKVPVERYDDLAAQGSCVYDISGRCGVYAKTDIQPLLNQGVSKEDIALSAFHAIAKQTIGGLAQGLEMKAPVLFEGGPLTFNPTLVDVFAERLGLGKDDIIKPRHPETIMALGTALSVDAMFCDDAQPFLLPAAIAHLEAAGKAGLAVDTEHGRPFFANAEEHRAFMARHHTTTFAASKLEEGSTLRAYLGIDSGSTTTKFALIDEDENLVDEFYAANEGRPLEVAKRALLALRDKYREAGLQLVIIAVGTTGYGELLFAKALNADHHAIETVAHTQAARHYVPDASFILDIGGQDMKAIKIDGGVISDIIVNEACSSGCGSFLENFASSLGIPAQEIATAAFASTKPAMLGSRCTVFMNSRIVSEQRQGKTVDDIMAGLCRSIIENVFTKVVRISNFDSLGSRIVVQGGTFKNDAVLCAFEQHTGKEAVLAPYPELMGAIGIALLTKQKVEGEMTAKAAENGSTQAQPASFKSSFIGLDALEGFSYTQRANQACPFCSNHCKRTVIEFCTGATWVTGNRCPRGEVLGDLRDENTRERLKEAAAKLDQVPDMFKVREELLSASYPHEQLIEPGGVCIGLPRVLNFWDTMPFWTSFFSALGFNVRLSQPSTRALYEDGLAQVTSDTVCFPAKLVHGHIKDLARAGVDRIFMPSITTVASENTEPTSESMCAIVKGYPIVVRNSDDPASTWGIPFDTPLFHWYSPSDRSKQLCTYMEDCFGIPAKLTKAAIAIGDDAMATFRSKLQAQGQAIIDEVEAKGSYAVVLASRPYQNDTLVNHNLPQFFTSCGIPVLTVDSLPGINKVDLSKSRLDIVNNYHARMLASALMAANSPNLEYVQLVSFGCGHDAYLTDEIIRLMRELSGKVPLVLKVDESDIEGPLHIRVKSFIETVEMRRAPGKALKLKKLKDPYPTKYRKQDRSGKVILVPNTSHAFCRLMTAAFNKQGLRAEALDYGREEAIRLGKKYVHNDICFPAQMTIGEALAALESGKYDSDKIAIGTGKYIGDCRLTHYAALLRKALDDAGYPQVPIITNDDVDYHDLHEGCRLSLASVIRIATTLPMVDALEELLRKMRPYELEPGAANAAFETALDQLLKGLEQRGVLGARQGFERAIDTMCAVAYDRSTPKPSVLIVGEYLLNFHPGANHDIENYLEQNGMEVIEARMTDVIRKSYFYKRAQIREYGVDKPLSEKAFLAVADSVFDRGHDVCDSIAIKHPLYEPAMRMPQLVRASDPIIHHTFDAGEGVLIPGEILHHAARGCKAFVILQPFSCLPNHVCGRGISKRIKEMYPDVQLLPLDFDPDASFANIENRLQMLIMNARATAPLEASEGDDWLYEDDAAESLRAKPVVTTGSSQGPVLATVKQVAVPAEQP